MALLNDAINASQSFVEVAGVVGIAGFVFDIADESQVILESEITDHYVEDGTAVQDHIALRPEKVTLKGYVGELPYTKDGGQTTLQKATQKLTTIASYLPAVSTFAQNLYSRAKTKNDALTALKDTGLDLYKTYRNVNIPHDKQSEAFIYFEALRNSRALFTVQTPFRYYTDMAIESIKSVQSSATRDESNFEVTFKKIRKVQTSAVNLAGLQGRLVNMASNVVKKGIVKGVTKLIGSFWK